MQLRPPRGPLRPYTCNPCPPSRTPSRALHASPALSSRYRSVFKHGTLREWALRMQQKDLDKWGSRGQTIPAEAKLIMRRADAMIANTLKKQALVYTGQTDPSVLEAADALVQRTQRPGQAERTAAQRAEDAAALREALRLYYLAGRNANGMLPVLGSRIIGVSNILAHRIYRTSEKLEEVLQTPPAPVHDEVGWGLREAPPRLKPAPEPKPRTIHNAAKPLSADATPAPGLYKPRTLRPLPALPLFPAERARLPLMLAFPGIGGGLPFSLAHSKAAASGLLGSPVPDPDPPAPVQRVRPNPVVGVGAGQPLYVRGRGRGGARPFPTTPSGSPLRFFQEKAKYLRLMVPYYLSTPAPPPPFPPPDPGEGAAAQRRGARRSRRRCARALRGGCDSRPLSVLRGYAASVDVLSAAAGVRSEHFMSQTRVDDPRVPVERLPPHATSPPPRRAH
ncbi:hypothetical protein B0H17DRAFT_355251 [Mycena rosella]|uniref:Uncharacterized protein n=1 Tax=Mycena rosella TaxID=1033263 RepID=A0AAD7DRV6_MYCRO|nr:hypothetical protein B0H17DRAFT_355251 [Mycena rosella]